MKQLVRKYLCPYFFRMGIGFGIKFGGTIMDLCIPYILAHIIDRVIPARNRPAVFGWGGLMLVSGRVHEYHSKPHGFQGGQ